MELIAVISRLHSNGRVTEEYDDVLGDSVDKTWPDVFDDAFEEGEVTEPGIYLCWYYDMDAPMVLDGLTLDIIYTVSEKHGKLVVHKGMSMPTPRVHRWPPRDE